MKLPHLGFSFTIFGRTFKIKLSLASSIWKIIGSIMLIYTVLDFNYFSLAAFLAMILIDIRKIHT